MGSMLGLLTSTIAFVVATFFLRRHLDDMGIPRTMGRSMVVFLIALGIAYGVAAIIDWATGSA